MRKTGFRRHFIQLPLLLLTLLASVASSALSLSDITVSSAVGERFYGVVELNGTRGITPNEVIVSLAPRSVYQRMGVDWEYFHTSLIFDVLQDERGEIYLRIVSSEVVFEPYLDFVISLRWPSGYLSKQYTVLLEMPALAPLNKPAAAPARQPAPAPATVEVTPLSSDPEPVLRSQTPTAGNQAPVASIPAAPASIPAPREGTGPAAEVSRDVSGAITRANTVKAETPDVIASEEPAQSVQAREAAPQQPQQAQQANVERDTSLDTEAASAIPVVEEDIVEDTVTEAAQPELAIVEQAPADEISGEAGVADKGIVNQTSVNETGVNETSVTEPLIEEAAVEKSIVEESIVEEAVVEERAEEQAKVEEVPVAETVAENKAVETPQPKPEPLAEPPSEAEPEAEPASKTDVATAEDSSQRWNHVSRSGDNLWRIARRIHAESGGNLKHIVDALYKNNPKAFMGNDANRLRVDAQLSVSLAQIRAAAPAAQRQLASVEESARGSIGTGDQAGSSASDRSAEADQASGIAAASGDGNSTATDNNSAAPEGVLSLVADDEIDDTMLSSQTLALSERSGELGEQFEAQAAASKARGDTVQDRIDNLYQQYSALSEKTEQLKELEQTLNRSIAEKAQTNLTLEANTDPALVLPGDTTALADAEQDTVAEPDNAPLTAQSEADRRRQFLLAALAIVVLIAAMLIFLRVQQQRRRAAMVDDWQLTREESRQAIKEQESISLDQIDATLAASRKELSEIEARHAQENQRSDLSEPSDGEGAVELEASVYIAYERYDEAERLLEEALENQPDNTVLQSQLLEVYAAKGKQQHFDLLAERIGNKGDKQIDSKINVLRNSL